MRATSLHGELVGKRWGVRRMERAAKIAIVCTELGVGGAERCVARLAVGLNRQQFDPHVVVLAAEPAADRRELVEQLRAAEVPIDFLGLSSAWQLAGGRRRLREKLNAVRPDLVQSFLFHGNVLALSTAPKNVPVVTGVRVADPRRWRHWVERRANRRAAKIVCVSRAVRDFCEQQAGFPGEKLCVIPNGISLEGLPALPLSADEPIHDWQGAIVPRDRKIVLCVGRLDHQKGYDWLLPQWARWSKLYFDCDLWIVGDGPDRERLLRQAEAEGAATRVRFLGQRADVPRLLASCELLLLPSRWEGMPNVVLEAMASAKAVLASRVEGVVELLGDDSADAQSASFGDVVNWGVRIGRLLSDPDRTQRLGAGNRKRIEEHFQVFQMVDRYERLYKKILTASTT